MHPQIRLGVALLCAGLAPSCLGSGPERDDALLGRSSALLAFHSSSAQDSHLYANARYQIDSSNVFGVDLEDKYDLIAIAVEAKLALKDVRAELKEGILHPQLFLEDGTSLAHCPGSELVERVPRSVRPQVEELNLDFLKLDPVDEELQGNLYFRLPEDAELDGAFLLKKDAAGILHEIDLRRSLLSFNYRRFDEVESYEAEFNVGVE